MKDSPLVECFLSRAAAPEDDSPWQTMERLVETMRLEALRQGCSETDYLEACLRLRGVTSLNDAADTRLDGFIEPCGSSFEEGFRVFLGRGAPRRRRFTLAHELCHTFFYEFAPEFKFKPHPTDDLEEALCNHGAGCLLVPRQAVTGNVSGPPSLESLKQLSTQFGVSWTTMFLRLLDLRYWGGALTFWMRLPSGEFVPERFYPERRGSTWRWTDTEVPERAWRSKETVSGRTFIYRVSAAGISFVRRVRYELRRQSNALVGIVAPT